MPIRVYLTGGATAVLYGWRESTIDVDLKLVPDSDPLLQALPRLKESLEVNVELVSPADFVPELAGWQSRSVFVTQSGPASIYHYDLLSQALAKLERGHEKDLEDVREMLRRRLVEPARLRQAFEEIAPKLYRYPAIDPKSFRRAVEDFLHGEAEGPDQTST